MTYEQWLFEYHALRKREETWQEVVAEALKALVRGIRDVLIGVLGLNFIKRAKKPAATTSSATSTAADDDVPDIIPAVYLFSRPEALKAYLNEAEKEDAAQDALKDDAFEQLSQALMRGDMVPIPASEPDMALLTAALGIKVGDPDHDVPLFTLRKKGVSITDPMPDSAPPPSASPLTPIPPPAPSASASAAAEAASASASASVPPASSSATTTTTLTLTEVDRG